MRLLLSRIEVLPKMDKNNEKLPHTRENDTVTSSTPSHMVAQQAASPVHQRRTLVATTDLGNKRILTSMYLPTLALCRPRTRSPGCRMFIREIRSSLRAHKSPIVRITLSNACKFRVTKGRCTRVCAPNEREPYGRESPKCCKV